MIRPSIFMIPVMILFLSGTSFNSEDKISINQDIPANVLAGDVFTVTLNIHKSAIEGAARLQQELPDGFVAEEMVSKGADFIFEDHRVKFIWTRLPVENDFVVSYRIRTDKNFTGRQTINGIFVYLNDGKTEKISITPVVVTMQNQNYNSRETPRVTRKLLSIAPKNGEYKMELTIHPNNMNEASRFTDEIPENFTAEVIDAKDATVSMEKGSIVFNWEKLPTVSEFTIAYIIRSGKPGPSPVINGYFTYENSTNDQQESKQIKINEVSPTGMTSSTSDLNQTVSAKKNEEPFPQTSGTLLVNDSKISPVAEQGIYFKVQISATQKSSAKNNNWFHTMFHIDSDVEMTYHEGWKKYLTGTFSSYKEAKSFKNQTQEKVPDAFIVAYENGIRIPLSEATRNKSLNQ